MNTPFCADPLASRSCNRGNAKHWDDYSKKKSYDRIPCGAIHAFAHAEVLRDLGDRPGMRIAAKSAALWCRSISLAKKEGGI